MPVRAGLADGRDVSYETAPHIAQFRNSRTVPPRRDNPPSTSSANQAQLIHGHLPSKLLFRVHDEKSASQLFGKDGFAARHDNYAHDKTGQPIGSQSWRIIYQVNYYSEGFLSQEMIQEDIIKHVLGGWPGYTREYTGQSEWISTSRSLDWSIWEIARRLIKLRRPYVELSVIGKSDSYKSNYKGNRMFFEDATKRIEEYGEKYWLTEDQKMALNFARASSEVACFGRIFKKDIVANTRWTRMAPGYSPAEEIMQPFFKPRSEGSGSWIEWLVFDPTEPFSVAAEKITKRREQLALSDDIVGRIMGLCI